MDIDAIIQELTRNESSMRFKRLKTICDHFFGQPRIKGSHHIYSTALPQAPLVNIQSDKGKAKRYQTRQVRSALEIIRERG